MCVTGGYVHVRGCECVYECVYMCFVCMCLCRFCVHYVYVCVRVCECIFMPVRVYVGFICACVLVGFGIGFGVLRTIILKYLFGNRRQI